MERSEKLIHIWNGAFPNYPLTLPDLKKPHAMIGAFFQVFNSLGIDIDAVISPPPEEERDIHTIYYWDLIPFINMTRIINHLLAVLQQTDKLSLTFPLTITHILEPDATTSHSVLLLLVNLTAFNENRLRDIAPFEEELFAKRDQVQALEEKKNRILEMVNEQAEEKGKRAERLEKLEQDLIKLEKDLEQQTEAYNLEKQELNTAEEESKQLEKLLDQKQTHRDALLAEVGRKKALRVTDAEDVRAQVEQAAQNVQEAEEKLNSLKETLMQKENSLQNLQKIKPNLDLANNLLNDVMKLSEGLKDLETGDLDMDSKDGELDVLNIELSELQSQLDELQAQKMEFTERRAENRNKRQLEKTHWQNALREAEENVKKSREKAQKSLQTIEEIKERIRTYEDEKKTGFAELEKIKIEFCSELKSYEEALLKKTAEAEKKIVERFNNRTG